MKNITILGSTGTIGRNTLDLISRNPGYRPYALTARSNVPLLAQQIAEYRPKFAVIEDESHLQELREAAGSTNTQIMAGGRAICDVAAMECDLVMLGIVGVAALAPAYSALQAGNDIGLANKECLVCAGDMLKRLAGRSGARIIPVDSEHYSIMRCIKGQIAAEDSVTITASGGMFREYSMEQMRDITPQQAVKHPNWEMGRKISVDSSTMMNKALELIEAHYLFGYSGKAMDVVIHPQSIVHAMVHYGDGNVIAALSVPDMRIPIAYALALGDDMDTGCAQLNLAQVGRLDFFPPDHEKFPALRLGYDVIDEGGAAPIIFNAANEAAVEMFLAGEIGFTDITRLVMHMLESCERPGITTLNDVLELDIAVRMRTRARTI